MDRIAKEAGASKERLYAYFGDKQALFDQVIRDAHQRFASALRIEQDDLVAYAGRLVEHSSHIRRICGCWGGRILTSGAGERASLTP